ncbi:MAG: UDP-N-acetylmuramoyl-L-alanyl-D-glutamate--2,6-diaminopimelate ligase [Deltaproteobacteria bacterium]|jgi:UDP-N-acetylmuramoyl-L-alanyl-D-glutamate--2,6-diaminopimelate ligase|nr:UDP-N-acetylmuramoyl-L-alanyl-D-glutamate--2,6-diaminopimelate ligase [Deltaproteobacteria bacterium]
MRDTSLHELQKMLRNGLAGLCADSRLARPGDIFVAMPGSRVDGAAFSLQAMQAGAVAVVGRVRPDLPASVPDKERLFVVSDDPARDLGLLAQALYGTDNVPFPVIGVTGTNGKTTVTYLLEHVFAAAGKKTGVLGTVSCRWPGHEEDASLTTPDTLHAHAMLAAMCRAGVQAAFMEVSSHALDQRRVAGIAFSGGVFTNLTQDHLDYHQDMEQYFEAKARLFREQAGGVKVVNAGDAWGRRLLAGLPDAIAYGLRDITPEQTGIALTGEILANTPAGLRLGLRWGKRQWAIRSPLIGAYNAENLLAALAVGLGFGFSPEQLDCFGDFCGVPGRLERVPARYRGQDLHVCVDYAHTPDALSKVLSTLRGVGFPRLITVFGCGGERDRAKRPLMGEVVGRLSDVAVLTSDNPRREDPLAIMADVMPGLQQGAGRADIRTEADRRRAIELALSLARPGDVVLIAGKGHERTQQIGDCKHPFSDQSVVRELASCA